MASGAQAQYMRSAPLRRLRHPLDESPAWSLLGSALGALLALLVGLPVLLLLAVLLPLTLAARWLLVLLYWNRRRPLISTESSVVEGAETMNINDCRWLGAAWRCSVLHAVLMFDGPVELSVLQQLVLSRVLPQYPRLTHRLHRLPLTGYCWLPDPHFHIHKHVFQGPCLSTDHQLQAYVSQLLSEGLLTDKSPWELHVLQSSDTATAVLRVHQSVADGPALVTLLCRCLADTKVPSCTTSRTDQSVGLYCRVVRSCVMAPLTVLLWLLLSARDCNLLTQRSAWSGRTTVSWSAATTLTKVIRVKQVTRSTVNCVLLAALAGALRVLLQSCGVRQPPDMRVVLPVDLCTDTRLGSQMSPVVVSLPVGVEGAVPRLWSTRRALRALRHSSDALVVYLATAALMTLLPAHSARSVLSAFTEDKASLQFSSVVGPAAAVLVGGCPLKSVYSLLPPQSGLSMAVSVITYGDQVFVAVATDSSLEPAGNMILSHFHAQVELMYTLLKNRRVPGEVKTEMILYRFPDVTRSPVRELASRLSLVQGEVERLSRTHSDATTHDTERLHRLKAEFTHLLRELRKRKSITESEPWEVQWRSRRRTMSCSFSRRSSMSVMTLLSTNRPASVIETSNISSTSPPLNSTLAFSDAPTTSDQLSSVFSVNYLSNCSSPSYENMSSSKYCCDCSPETADNNNEAGVGLYDEILSALERKEVETEQRVGQTLTPPNKALTQAHTESNNLCNLGYNDLDFRDHTYINIAQAKTSYKNRFSKRTNGSQTMSSIFSRNSIHQNEVLKSKKLLKRSLSCSALSSYTYKHNNDYAVVVESLSNFASGIRRLSLENTLEDTYSSESKHCSDGNSFTCSAIEKPRKFSKIPLRKVTVPCHRVDINPLSDLSQSSSPLPPQPLIYEFV